MSGRRSALLERPVMREQFRSELRGRLMSEAVAVLAPRSSRFSFALSLRPALAGSVMLVLVLAGATSAAASSLPGDPLYAVKRAGEDARLAITLDQPARLLLLSDLADRRLEELAEVARQRPAAANTATEQYADAVERVAQALDEGSNGNGRNDQEGQNVEDAQAKRLATLDSIKATIPDNARAGVETLIKRERDRHAKGPTAPRATDAPRGGDDDKRDGDETRKATPRAATPNPQRATPSAFPRSNSNENDRDEGRDEGRD